MKDILIEDINGSKWVSFDGWTFKLPSNGRNRLKKKTKLSSSNGEIFSPMPGNLLKVLVKDGQEVNESDSLCVVEAMKMEHTLKSPFSGTVMSVNFKAGDTLQSSDIILTVKKKDA